MEGKKKNSYIYQVELLVEDNHHTAALEQLFHKLNEANFVDYKIISGISLGKEIDSRKLNATEKQSVPVPAKKQSIVHNIESNETSQLELGIEAMKVCKDKNKLIRLIVNRGLGIKLSIPCRVINVDEEQLLITVYHVDEKQVYTFRLIEIEDFFES